MNGHRHTPEQAVRKLREGDRMLAKGQDMSEVLRQLEIAGVMEVERFPLPLAVAMAVRGDIIDVKRRWPPCSGPVPDSGSESAHVLPSTPVALATDVNWPS